ncbi:MAG: hypothetical protein JXR51_16810 [Bacteroidales bacterium]|nr:hypothetical protein [Bacteroidales bacterium]MBN2758830.1 hypothetical protein [Bacteroidales bacterium]
MSKKNKIKKRSTKEKFKIYHEFYKRSGLYLFLGKNFLKLILILASIILIILLLDKIFDLKHQQEIIRNFVEHQKPIYVYLIFIISESIMGIIPPDIFIIWAKTRYIEHPYLIVTILATFSYIGGINAYYIGLLIRRLPRVKKFISVKYEKNFDMIEKWGGIVIIMAAMFPLPFAMISTIAGIVNYPFKNYLLYGLTRYIRFYLYAMVIFGVLKNFI